MGILTDWFENRFHPAQTPPDWVASLGAWETASGVDVTPQGALGSTAVFAAIRVLAETLASLPLVVYRRRQPRGKDRARDHYLFDLLHDAPNPEMTSFELRETLMGHLGGWGNAFAEIEIDGAGRARALWPLRPDRMRVRRRNGRLEYVYRLPEKVGAENVVLQADRVLHVRGLGFDGWVGYSPVQLARQAVALSLATEEFGARFFGNGARPGAVLEHPGKLGDEAYDHLKESWETRHMGLEKAHRVAILEEGMKLHEVGIPPEDAQFLETRKFQVTEIARLYRVPPHMIGDLERATFTNIEHQAIEFVVHTIRPWLVRWEQALHRDVFLPRERGEFFAEFLVDGLLRGDAAARNQSYAVGRQWGWLSADDVRELENMNPLPDGAGESYLVPLNMMPAGAVPDSRTSREMGLAFDERLRDLSPERRAEIRQADAERLADDRLRLAASTERVLVDVAGRVIRREVNDVRRAADRLLVRADNPAGFSEWLREFYADHREFWARNLLPVMLAFADQVGLQVARELDTDPHDAANIEAFLDDFVAALAMEQVSDSEGQLRALLEDALAQAEDAAAAIEERLDAWEETRAQGVARDESRRAGNAFAREFYLLAGILRLEWINRGSENCPYCRAMNGVIVGIQEYFLGKDEAFEPDGADRPLRRRTGTRHPPLHAGCDCQVIANRG